jgi:hypothetical protein
MYPVFPEGGARLSLYPARKKTIHIFPSSRKGNPKMRIIIWSLFALAMLLWTGTALIAVHFVDWTVQTFGNTLPTAQELGAVAEAIPLPAWLAVWVDPAWAQIFQAGFGNFIEVVSQSAPFLASAISWLSPLIWGIWGLGVLVLLIAAALGHWLLGTLKKSA